MKILTLLCLFTVGLTTRADNTTIDLAGQWQFAMGSEVMPIAFTDMVTLPGTTDTNMKGEPLSSFGETTHLSRRYSFKGRAWYRREVEIPSDWADRTITLLMERTKYTEVFVDGQPAGNCNDISTPQRYDLSLVMTPGRHLLTIMVDNSSGMPQQLYANSHAYTEDTQTNWNGIIGRIELMVSQQADNTQKTTTCTQTLTIRDHHFYLNGHRIFLRGKHDACVWPLTGHVPMDVPSWLHYLGTCAGYGINHVRFHSWCPPEAAFTAADSLNIILQPELPFWGDFNDADTLLMDFLHKEGIKILREYGHHKSFRMFALGNELWGSIGKMKEFVDDFRRVAPDKLYTFGSNYYLGYQGVKPGMDYFTTCRVGGESWGNYNTHTRGSFSFADAADGGMINHFRPNAQMNFEEGCALSPVPVISHETGQFQTYPDYNEISKYTGVLRPSNMETFKQRLKKAGMGNQAEAFHRASGRWSYLLYKQDIEMDLRTPNMAGFQLLDLQDYPGQGSAYVGILDAFMDSKGICTQEEWQQFCSPVVPLLVSDAYCFTFSQGIHGRILLANYGGSSLSGNKLNWECAGQKGQMVIPDGEGLLNLDTLNISLSHLRQATKLKLILSTGNYKNSYDLWAYPDKMKLNKKGILIAHEMTDNIGKKLEQGAKVLLMPDSTAASVGGLFQTDYWNYRMFKTISENNKKQVSPGTLGLLCNPEHPLFKDFPTDEHTSWQWFPIVKESHPMVLDNLTISPTDNSQSQPFKPIVQVIDNIERNHKLGLVFEFQVGKGRLLIVMSNLDNASKYPEGHQFYASVLNYMKSKDFTPETRLSLDQLRNLFIRTISEIQLDELNNISPY